MNLTDAETDLFDLIIDAAYGGLEDQDAGEELERLGIAYPQWRAEIYATVIAQQEYIARWE
jgi:hypothetical protein